MARSSMAWIKKHREKASRLVMVGRMFVLASVTILANIGGFSYTQAGIKAFSEKPYISDVFVGLHLETVAAPTQAAAGGKVTFTVTATRQGQLPSVEIPVMIDLSRVVDNADIVGGWKGLIIDPDEGAIDYDNIIGDKVPWILKPDFSTPATLVFDAVIKPGTPLGAQLMAVVETGVAQIGVDSNCPENGAKPPECNSIVTVIPEGSLVEADDLLITMNFDPNPPVAGSSSVLRMKVQNVNDEGSLPAETMIAVDISGLIGREVAFRELPPNVVITDNNILRWTLPQVAPGKETSTGLPLTFSANSAGSFVRLVVSIVRLPGGEDTVVIDDGGVCLSGVLASGSRCSAEAVVGGANEARMSDLLLRITADSSLLLTGQKIIFKTDVFNMSSYRIAGGTAVTLDVGRLINEKITIEDLPDSAVLTGNMLRWTLPQLESGGNIPASLSLKAKINVTAAVGETFGATARMVKLPAGEDVLASDASGACLPNILAPGSLCSAEVKIMQLPTSHLLQTELYFNPSPPVTGKSAVLNIGLNNVNKDLDIPPGILLKIDIGRLVGEGVAVGRLPDGVTISESIAQWRLPQVTRDSSVSVALPLNFSADSAGRQLWSAITEMQLPHGANIPVSDGSGTCLSDVLAPGSVCSVAAAVTASDAEATPLVLETDVGHVKEIRLFPTATAEYTLVATNNNDTTARTPVTVDISSITLNARVEMTESGTDLTLSPDNKTLVWNPGQGFPPKKTVEITYLIRANGNAPEGVQLTNKIVTENSNCAIGSSDPRCVATAIIVKDPAGIRPEPVPGPNGLAVKTLVDDYYKVVGVRPGQELRYSIVLKNTSNKDIDNVEAIDNLAGIISGADLVPESLSGLITNTAGDTLIWDRKKIPAGQTVTLKYRIDVHEAEKDSNIWGKTLNNKVHTNKVAATAGFVPGNDFSIFSASARKQATEEPVKSIPREFLRAAGNDGSSNCANPSSTDLNCKAVATIAQNPNKPNNITGKGDKKPLANSGAKILTAAVGLLGLVLAVGGSMFLMLNRRRD